MIDDSAWNATVRRPAHTACRVFKGAWGCFPNERIRPLGPGCIAREQTKCIFIRLVCRKNSIHENRI